MKAVLTPERFSDPDWIFERKLDGIRCIAIRDGGDVKLLSRNDLSLNGRYPHIVADLEGQACRRFAIDGEVVAFEGAATSFQALGRPDATIFYYVFDLLWLDGEDVRERPLRERKSLLKNALNFQNHVRLTAHRNEEGEAMFAEACSKGWEGVIAKRADSVYSAKRSKDWLKFKCEQGQELVIGGYTAPRGSREEFGALLVGHFEPDGTFRYAGKVGTGFDRATLKDLGARMRALTRDTTPFADSPNYRDATWIEPELVAQLGFSEWTTAGRLRHPRFQGLRFDKAAREVVREAR
jgi:DNA ligase D-like protein (predicted ligase)